MLFPQYLSAIFLSYLVLSVTVAGVGERRKFYTDFLHTYKIVLGLTGEQRGEDTRAFMNELKIRASDEQSGIENQNPNEKRHDYCITTPTIHERVGKPANKVTAQTNIRCSPHP